MLDVAQGKGIVSRHDEIAQDGKDKGQQKAGTRNLRHVAHYIMVMVLPQFVMEYPKGHSEKEQAKEGTEAMESSFFHFKPI